MTIPKPTDEDLSRVAEIDQMSFDSLRTVLFSQSVAEAMRDAGLAWLRRAVSAESKIEAVEKMMAGDPELVEMTYRPQDGFQMDLKHWGVRMLAEHLLHSLKSEGAENYLTMTL